MVVESVQNLRTQLFEVLMQVLALQLDVQLHDQPSRTEQQPGLLMLCGEGPGASDDRDPGWAGSHNTPKRGPKGVQGGCVLPTEPGQESRPAELNIKPVAVTQ